MKKILFLSSRKLIKSAPVDVDERIKIFIRSNHIVVSEAKTLPTIARKKNYSRSINQLQ